MTLTYGSVCSGIEAASVAWHVMGWRPAFFAEIDAFPRAVLAHHYPDVPLHGDFTTIKAGDYAAIDVLVGGTPCQSFSVAGLRAGLDDERGNLALEFCRLARRLGPRWVVWENVPGVLSLDGGRAFASILGGLADCGYGLAYRVLDAQFVRIDGFGRAVPQRRRRVFIVGCLGDWRRAAAVLFERASLRGDPPPRRQAGQGVAHSVTARAGNGSRPAGATGNIVGFESATEFLPQSSRVYSDGEVAPALEAAGTRMDNRAPQVCAFGGNNQSGPIDVATAQTAHGGTGRMDFETETFVAHALRADGFDASEDGTGRGTRIIPIDMRQASRGDKITNNRDAAKSSGGAPGHGIGEAGDPAFTVSERGQAVAQPICFDETQITSATNRCQPRAGDPSHPRAAGARPPTLAFHARQDPDSGPVTHPLDTDGTSIGILTGWRVRRLTPEECERLQGFPDRYTAIPYRGKPAADGPRYKALGNSMAVNVMRWIGRRIEMVEAIPPEDDSSITPGQRGARET